METPELALLPKKLLCVRHTNRDIAQGYIKQFKLQVDAIDAPILITIDCGLVERWPSQISHNTVCFIEIHYSHNRWCNWHFSITLSTLLESYVETHQVIILIDTFGIVPVLHSVGRLLSQEISMRKGLGAGQCIRLLISNRTSFTDTLIKDLLSLYSYWAINCDKTEKL